MLEELISPRNDGTYESNRVFGLDSMAQIHLEILISTRIFSYTSGTGRVTLMTFVATKHNT
jgi:hypothetical protein